MRDRKHYTAANFLNAKSATGASNVIPCSDYRNVVIMVTAPANSTFTIKFCGSIGDTAFDATAAQSTTNAYDFLECIDLQDGSAIDGDTGILIDNTTAAVNCRMFEINVNCIDFIAAQITSYTDGSASACITLTDNA